MKKFIQISLLSIFLLGSSLTASAYTVDEIIANSEHMVCLYKYSPWKTSLTTNITQYPLWYGATNGETLKLTKLSDTEILMSGFKGTLDLVFVLYNSTSKKIDTNGDELRFYRSAPTSTVLNGTSLTGKITSVNNTKAFGLTAWKFTEYNVVYMQSGGTGGNWYLYPSLSNKASSNTFISLKIKKDNKGLYFLSDNLTLSNTNARMFTLHNGTQETNTSKVGGAAYMPAYFIDNIEMVPIRDFNMTVTENYSHFQYHTNTFKELQKVERQYPVALEIDEASKTFTIRNFSNLGFAYTHSNSLNAVNFNSKNASSIRDALYAGNRMESYQGVGDQTFGHKEEAYVTGSINANGELVIDRTQIVRNALLITSINSTSSTAADYWNLNWYDMRPTYLNENGDRTTYDGTKEILGTISNIEDGKPQHNKVEKSWVTNDGLRRTYDGGMIVEFSPYTYVASSVSNNRINYTTLNKDLNFVDGYSGTTMHSIDADCTNGVELSLDRFQYNNQLDNDNDVALAVQLSLTTNAHDQYVDHYEVMVAPGNFSSINDAGFVYDPENGISRAMMISAGPNDKSNNWYVDELSTLSVDNSKDHSISKYFTKADLDNTYASDGKYTFFVRTVYKDGLNLAPTFHSMVYEVPQTPTSVGSIFADKDENSTPVYYNLQGVRVENPTVPGVYVRMEGKTATKVIIR